MTYQTFCITPSVTDDHKRAVWAALGGGKRLMLEQLADASGVDSAIVSEVWAQGFAAGKLAYQDDGAGFRGIVRVEAGI